MQVRSTREFRLPFSAFFLEMGSRSSKHTLSPHLQQVHNSTAINT